MAQTKGRQECTPLFSEKENSFEYIPGAMHKCKADSELTILAVSESFLALFGCTKDDIQMLYHDHFTEMIYDKDRETVALEMKRQMKQGDVITLKYRIQRNNGELLWIVDQGRCVTEQDGSTVFYCMLLDITELQMEKEQLSASLERYKVIMDQSADIIFEWDIWKDTLVYSSNWYKKFSYKPVMDHVSTKILESEHIYSEDKKFLKEIITDTAAGVPYSETEFRISDGAGGDICCRVRVSTQYDSEENPVNAIGVISDISREKKQRQMLIEQAQRDSLTGLLHKAAARQTIEAYLSHTESPQGLILLIDLDDFKQVNDTYGHLCGDELIADTASVLHQTFRSGDIISRVGGDEFLVFIPGTAYGKMEERVKSMREALSKIKVADTEEILSCSVGVAFFPSHACDFNSLYRCADLALYHVKAKGKGATAVYNSSMEKGGFPNKLVKTAVNSVIDSDGESVCQVLGQYSFRMLYHALDVMTAVYDLLDIIGSAYNVSRVYIFEDSPDGKCCSNTFEWCNEGIQPSAAEKQKLSYRHTLGDYPENFDEHGIFYCGDIRRLTPSLYKFYKEQGTCSLLQCAIEDKGQFRGFVGFDECAENRHWTNEQIETLTLTSKVLSTFLLKYRLEEKLKLLEKTE